MNRFNQYISFFVGIFFILVLSNEVLSKEKLLWYRYDMSPFYTWGSSEVKPISGITYDVEKVLVEKMPEYEHDFIKSNVKRAFYDIKQGKKACIVAIVRNSDRAKFMHFSLFNMVIPSYMLVVRKEDLGKFGSKVSLEKLLKNKNLKFSYAAKRSYGKEIDAIIKKHEKQENVTLYSGNELSANLMKMLNAKRVDFIIEYGFSFPHLTKVNKIKSDKLALVIIEESKPFSAAATGCTKNKWGKQIIDKLNTVIKKVALTDEFFNMYIPYVDQNIIGEYRKAFVDIINNDIKKKKI